MGRRKNLKQRQANAAGRARNRAREAAAPAAPAEESGGGTDPEMENECPKCGALPGHPCVTPSGNPTRTHKARG